MTTQGDWIERARKALKHRREALGFISRAKQRFPNSSPDHAPAIAHLWLKAEEVDHLFYNLLQEMNQGLVGDKGKLDVTRGATLRMFNQPLTPASLPESPSLKDLGLGDIPLPKLARELAEPILVPTEVLVYNCTWTLLWNDGARGVSIELGIEPQEGTLLVRVYAEHAPEVHDLSFPPEEEAVKEALLQTFVSEASHGEAENPTAEAAGHDQEAQVRR